MGQTTNRNRARLPSLFSIKFTQVPSQYSKQIKEVQTRSEVWVCVKAPSHCVSCKSSTAFSSSKNQLHLLLQTIDCRKVWGKQLTGTGQGSTHFLVWNSHKCLANTANELEKYATAPSCHVSCKSSTTLWLFKQSTALLQTIDCRKMWGQATNRNRARLPSLFGMKFTQIPSQECSNRFAEQTILPNNSVAFHLIMIQRDGEKWSWMIYGGRTLISIDWHPFGVLEADDYHQNNRWWFGNQLIFINYIFMKKNEFKLLYTNYIKEIWSRND
jgi:hypothetical protein